MASKFKWCSLDHLVDPMLNHEKIRQDGLTHRKKKVETTPNRINNSILRQNKCLFAEKQWKVTLYSIIKR